MTVYDDNVLDYLQYNSYFSEKHNLLYIATPKVACTTLKWWFAALEGYEQQLWRTVESAESDLDLVIHDSFYKVAPNVTGLSPEVLTGHLDSDTCFRFALVRNPFKRLFSSWQSKLLLREPLQIKPYVNSAFYNHPITSGQDIALAFEGFLEHLASHEAPDYLDVHWTPQARLLRPDLIAYSKVVQIENADALKESLHKIIGQEGADPFALPRKNVSLIPYSSSLLTDKACQLIRELYAEDFETFEYSLQQPQGKAFPSPDQLDVILKAVELIRGRHQRIDEMREGNLRRVSLLHQNVEEQASQVRGLQELISERDRLISERDRLISERDRQVVSLHHKVGERDSQVVSLKQQVGELANQEQVLQQQISELGNALTRSQGAVQSLTRQVGELHAKVGKRDAYIESFQQIVLASERLLAKRNQTIKELNRNLSGVKQGMLDRDAEIEGVYASISWRLTKPLRDINRLVSGGVRRNIRQAFSQGVHRVWRKLPITAHSKTTVKNTLFEKVPFLFKWTAVYRQWQFSQQTPAGQLVGSVEAAPPQALGGTSTYIPLVEDEPPSSKPVRLICFYLPQFHEIPENDLWWGEGFTEWTNVRPAQPQFVGHYQPHVPGELGYYDLFDSSVQRRQVELAKLYGIGGFCFYFYWFAGKRLLEMPIQKYLVDASLDLPFCLCWANENWSRRWDGMDHNILIAQNHSPDDDLAFIEYIARYLKDERYIRIDGKPLLVVYRPNLLPSAKATGLRWRNWCREHGIGEIYLACTQSLDAVDPSQIDFDAAIEFPPNNFLPADITKSVTAKVDFSGTIYDWQDYVARNMEFRQPDYSLFRTVCPSWDNTARRKNKGTIYHNSSPELYQHWLECAIHETGKYRINAEERLVFINAWNEWAEGTHLEPDQRYGYAYLQATRDALGNAVRREERSVLLVTQDCRPHGAQLLILAIAKQLKDSGFKVATIALEGGVLQEDFCRLGRFINAEETGTQKVNDFLSTVKTDGIKEVITSTVVCGQLVPQLSEMGFQVMSLVHEFPDAIRTAHQEENAKFIASLADKVVFASELVHSAFCDKNSLAPEKAVVLPQGLIRKNSYTGRHPEAHRLLCTRHNLPGDSEIVLSIAYTEAAEGDVALFVELAALVLKERPRVVFIWAGHGEQEILQAVTDRVHQLGIQDKVLFTGFEREPEEYFAAASVYVLTAREEPLSNVVLKSAEVGVPVVAFRQATGAGDCILKHGGRLASDLDLNDYSGKICELLDDKRQTPSLSLYSLKQYTLDLLHYLNGYLRISVIVPNYNYADHIERRLESIYNQTVPVYEVIVLDDASEDNSVEIIKKYLDATGNDARLIINGSNSGSVFRQWRKGLDCCHGDLVWIAEADDLSESNFLETLSPCFRNPELVLAYSQSKQIDEHDNLLAENYLEYTKDISNCWLTNYVRDGREEIGEALSIKNTILNVSAVLFQRKALEKALESLGEQLFTYRLAGDWLVYLHVLVQGQVYFDKKPLNHHRRHSNSVTKSTEVNDHLTEVAQLQGIARSLTTPSKEARLKASAYLDSLKEYLEMPEN